MSQVFVSHASEDRERALALVTALRDEGLDVWWDADLRAGTAYAGELQTRVERAACVVVLWSRHAIDEQRTWIRSEADEGRRRGVLVPVRLDPVAPPKPYDQIQTIDLIAWIGDRGAPAFRKLVADIRAWLAAPPATTPSAPKRSGRRALLVALSRGADAPALPAAQSNVQRLAEALAWPECEFEVVSLLDPDGRQLMRAIADLLAPASHDDFVLLYFAGHVNFTGFGPFLPARNSELPAGVSLALIKQMFLDQTQVGHLFIVLDACYGDTAKAEVEAQLRTQLGPGPGKVLLATSAGPAARPEAWQDAHSPLTGLLLHALSNDAADSNHDGISTVEEVLQAIQVALGDGVLPLVFNTKPSEMQLRRRSGSVLADIKLQPLQQQFVDRIAPVFWRGGLIPFLGDGIWDGSQRNYYATVKQLSERAGLGAGHNPTIAAAAEALQFERGRQAFLAELREILGGQPQLAPPPAFDLILDMKPPWFVISTTHDLELERALDEAGRSYVLVSHVLRSVGDDIGKALVLRSAHHPRGQDPATAAAVRLTSELEAEIDDDDCVIYKLLGSPFLAEHPAVRDRELDTVVITESDHITFLAQLEHQHTTIPSAFAPPLHTRRLLFLGFNLDIWHYRLIGHAFFRREPRLQRRAARDDERRSGPLAVREPASTLEQRLWEQFHVDMSSIELPTLVRALRARRPA